MYLYLSLSVDFGLTEDGLDGPFGPHTSCATVFYDFGLTGIKNQINGKPNHFVKAYIWTF